MATTTVRKGQNRKAAEASREKHAQRTPLPGDDAPADNFDSMGLPELKQIARAQGWSTLDKSTKREIVHLLREYPGGAPDNAHELVSQNTKESKVDEKPAAKKSDDNIGQQVAARIAAARENGYSRKDIADAASTTQSVIWRMQAKAFVKPLEVESIVDALNKIEAGEIEPTRRGRPRGSESTTGTRAVLQSKLQEVHDALSEVPVTSKKVTEYREAIDKALTIIDGVLSS